MPKPPLSRLQPLGRFAITIFGAVLALQAPAAMAQGAASAPAGDPCVLAAQRASVGVFKSLEQGRLPGTPLNIEASQWIERNLWREPDTLILRFFADGNATEPFLTITEDLTETGMIVTTTSDEGTTREAQVFTYDCAFDEASGAYRFDMYYENDFGGVPHDFMNQIEGHGELLSLVRLARPKGSTGPYRWISTLSAARMDTPD